MEETKDKEIGYFIRTISRSEEKKILNKALRNIIKTLNGLEKELLCQIFTGYLNRNTTPVVIAPSLCMQCIPIKILLRQEMTEDEFFALADQIICKFMDLGIKLKLRDNLGFLGIQFFDSVWADKKTYTIYFAVYKGFEPCIPMALKYL